MNRLQGRVALIVGAGGQDGRLLAAHLRRVGVITHEIHREFFRDVDGKILAFSVLNPDDVAKVIARLVPDYVFYLAAHHSSSQSDPLMSSREAYDLFHKAHVVGLHSCLEAVRLHSTKSRIFYASSSLIFDGSNGPVQNEETLASPVGFYGLTKLQGMMLCREYRKSYSVFTSSGILYSHESAFRSKSFLSTRIIHGVYEIAKGRGGKIAVGDLDAINDWGYAEDYVRAFLNVLLTDQPQDYIISSGEGHTVKEFAALVCGYFGLELADCVYGDPSLLRRKVSTRIGDHSKLTRDTGWKPLHRFDEMVNRLIEDHLQRDRHVM